MLPKPKIEFEYDEPVALTLRHAQGFKVASRYHERWPGDTEQYLFFALEGVFYLSDTAGGLLNARLRARGIAAGETVFITKIKAPNPNSTRAVIEYIPLKMLRNSDDEFRTQRSELRCPKHAQF